MVCRALASEVTRGARFLPPGESPTSGQRQTPGTAASQSLRPAEKWSGGGTAQGPARGPGQQRGKGRAGLTSGPGGEGAPGAPGRAAGGDPAGDGRRAALTCVPAGAGAAAPGSVHRRAPGPRAAGQGAARPGLEEVLRGAEVPVLQHVHVVLGLVQQEGGRARLGLGLGLRLGLAGAGLQALVGARRLRLVLAFPQLLFVLHPPVLEPRLDLRGEGAGGARQG